MKQNIEELRKKYINNPPEGLSSLDILSMSDEELLDMDYFMNEDLDDDIGEEGFYIFYKGRRRCRHDQEYVPDRVSLQPQQLYAVGADCLGRSREAVR